MLGLSRPSVRPDRHGAALPDCCSNAGSQLKLRVHPGDAARFQGWSGGDIDGKTGRDVTLTAGEDVKIRAKFSDE